MRVREVPKMGFAKKNAPELVIIIVIVVIIIIVN